MPKKNNFKRIKTALSNAEERGFRKAVFLMMDFVNKRIEAEVKHRPDQNVHKRKIWETWVQMVRFTAALERGEVLDGKSGPNQWELPDGTV